MNLASVTYSPTVILTGVKSLSYAANMQATRLAKAQGADEAVLVRPDGIVLEPPTSTIFWVSARRRAADPSSRWRASWPRSPAAGISDELEVEEGEFTIDDLRGAREAFLASTVREVQPVSADRRTELPSCPGRAHGEAREAFAAVLAREMRSRPRPEA